MVYRVVRGREIDIGNAALAEAATILAPVKLATPQSANERPAMTEVQANAVYTVLEDICRARPEDRMSFVLEYTQGHRTAEWRLFGALGVGGKFRYPKFSVDCYREDETPERGAMIAAANAKLAILRVECGFAPRKAGTGMSLGI